MAQKLVLGGACASKEDLLDQADSVSDRSSDDVIEAIRATLSTAISTGALLPGVKLQEEVIARHFGVSRTVARGAVAILQRERLVDRRRNHGAFIATPEPAEAKQLLETRRVLELAIVQRATQSATAADLERLDTIIRDEDVIANTESAHAPLAWGNFHVELADIAGNMVLTEFVKNVVTRMALVSALYERKDAVRCGSDHHREIVEAMRRRDIQGASAAMVHHLDEMEAGINLRDQIDDQSSLSAVLEKFAPSA
jgi:DNA-binding GntR family transcriptional regulator